MAWLYVGSNTALGKNGYGLAKVDPYNPLDLPPFTIRLLFTDGFNPVFRKGTAVQVSASPNIWDLTYVDPDWSSLLIPTGDIYAFGQLLEIMGANSTGVTNLTALCPGDSDRSSKLTSVALFDTSMVTSMRSVFPHHTLLQSIPHFDTHNVEDMSHFLYDCRSLVNIPLFDTSHVTNTYSMLDGCRSLQSVPEFDLRAVTDASWMFHELSVTSFPSFNLASLIWAESMFRACDYLTQLPNLTLPNVSSVNYMFAFCYRAQSGIVDMYNKLRAKRPTIHNHTYTFRDCGSRNSAGQAELAQIPSDWK